MNLKRNPKIVKTSWGRDAKGEPVKTLVLWECAVVNCRNLVNRKTQKSPICGKHRAQQWRENHPLNYSYHKLAWRAKERGKTFSLTRKEYIQFAEKTDYARMKGKTSLSLSIDRIDNDKGYEASNIKAITLRENSRKQFIPYFARQMENASYKPTDEELANVQKQLTT